MLNYLYHNINLRSKGAGGFSPALCLRGAARDLSSRPRQYRAAWKMWYRQIGGTDSGFHLRPAVWCGSVYITAHQLLPPGDELPGSSLNQAYCLTLEGDARRVRDLDMESRVYINRHFSAGSNPGFALAQRDQVNQKFSPFAKACPHARDGTQRRHRPFS